MTRGDRWAVAAYWCLVAATVVLLLLQRRIYLVDYPDLVLQGMVLQAKLTGAAGAELHELKAYPVPNALAAVLLAALGSILPPLVAAKVFVTGYVVAFAAVLVRLCRAFAAGSAHARAIALWPLTVLTTPFWWGNLGFQWGVLLLGVYLLLARRAAGRLPTALPTAILALLVFFAHAIPFLVLVVHALGSSRSRRTTACGLIPSAVMGAWYLWGRYVVHGNVEAPAPALAFEPTPGNLLLFKAHALARRGPFQNFSLADGHSHLDGARWLLWILLVLHVLDVVVLAACLWRDVQIRPGQRSTWFYLALALLALLTPPHLFGVASFGERLLVIAVLGYFTGCRLGPSSACWLAVLGAVFWLHMLGFLAATVVRPPSGTVAPDRAALGFTDRLLDVPVFARADYYESIEAQRLDRELFGVGPLRPARLRREAP